MSDIPFPQPDNAGSADGRHRDEGGVERAAQLLDSLDQRPLSEHADAYEQVHAELSETLASIDDA